MNTILTALEKVIQERATQAPESSYVASLNHKGLDHILKKIGEESGEVIIAAKNQQPEAVIYESCDLLFHLMVLLQHQGITLTDIEAELTRRFGTSGIEEKANRSA